MGETNMGYQILINGRSAFGTTYGLSALQMTIRSAQWNSRQETFDGDKIEVVNEDHTKTFWSSELETAQ
jgi:hypothetical protein